MLAIERIINALLEEYKRISGHTNEKSLPIEACSTKSELFYFKLPNVEFLSSKLTNFQERPKSPQKLLDKDLEDKNETVVPSVPEPKQKPLEQYSVPKYVPPPPNPPILKQFMRSPSPPPLIIDEDSEEDE